MTMGIGGPTAVAPRPRMSPAVRRDIETRLARMQPAAVIARETGEHIEKVYYVEMMWKRRAATRGKAVAAARPRPARHYATLTPAQEGEVRALKGEVSPLTRRPYRQQQVADMFNVRRRTVAALWATVAAEARPADKDRGVPEAARWRLRLLLEIVHRGGYGADLAARVGHRRPEVVKTIQVLNDMGCRIISVGEAQEARYVCTTLAPIARRDGDDEQAPVEPPPPQGFAPPPAPWPDPDAAPVARKLPTAEEYGRKLGIPPGTVEDMVAKAILFDRPAGYVPGQPKADRHDAALVADRYGVSTDMVWGIWAGRRRKPLWDHLRRVALEVLEREADPGAGPPGPVEDDAS